MDEHLERTILAAKGGDATALDDLFARNLAPLVAFVRLRAGGIVAERESASDIAQSVCRQAIEDMDDFEFRDESGFRNWLFLKATRKILDRYRFHRRKRRDVGREVSPESDSAAGDQAVLEAYATLSTPSKHAVAQEEMARVESALGKLPEAQREAVLMSRLLGIDYPEIAATLGRSEAAVRGLVARGLAQLTSLLED